MKRKGKIGWNMQMISTIYMNYRVCNGSSFIYNFESQKRLTYNCIQIRSSATDVIPQMASTSINYKFNKYGRERHNFTDKI